MQQQYLETIRNKKSLLLVPQWQRTWVAFKLSKKLYGFIVSSMMWMSYERKSSIIDYDNQSAIALIANPNIMQKENILRFNTIL
jgi:hypothetical protein